MGILVKYKTNNGYEEVFEKDCWSLQGQNHVNDAALQFYNLYLKNQLPTIRQEQVYLFTTRLGERFLDQVSDSDVVFRCSKRSISTTVKGCKLSSVSASRGNFPNSTHKSLSKAKSVGWMDRSTKSSTKKNLGKGQCFYCPTVILEKQNKYIILIYITEKCWFMFYRESNRRVGG